MNANAFLDQYRIAQLFAQLRKDGTNIPDSGAVQEYILSHAGMIEVVALAAALTAVQLRKQADLSLELSRDPEIDDPTLVLYIRPWPHAPNLYDAIDQAEAQIVGALERAQGWLSIMPDYRLHA